MPEEEEVKRGKWTFAHLPAIPSNFALKPIEKSRIATARLLLKLIKRKDVDAPDQCLRRGARRRTYLPLYRPVREDRNKPIKRLWLQSMTQDIHPRWLRHAAHATRHMHPLADAAVCRSEVGLAGGHQRHARDDRIQFQIGGFQLTTVGRVQTPTLAILVEREEKIRAFKRARLLGTASAPSAPRRGEYDGRWFDESFKKADDDADARAERLWDEGAGRSDRRQVRGQAGHRYRGDQAFHADVARRSTT